MDYYYHITIITIIFIHNFIVFACIGTFPPGQKPHLRVFFLVYARLTPPSWQMLQIQAGFTMTFWEFVIYSLRTGNHDQ